MATNVRLTKQFKFYLFRNVGKLTFTKPESLHLTNMISDFFVSTRRQKMYNYISSEVLHRLSDSEHASHICQLSTGTVGWFYACAWAHCWRLFQLTVLNY